MKPGVMWDYRIHIVYEILWFLPCVSLLSETNLHIWQSFVHQTIHQGLHRRSCWVPSTGTQWYMRNHTGCHI